MLDYTWLRNLRNGVDVVQQRWNDWVIEFGASSQAKMFSPLGLDRMTPTHLVLVMFAAIGNGGCLGGFNVDGVAGLVPLGVGVTADGLAYALVHDVYIHGRLGWFRGRRVAAFDRLADAHRIHHLYNAAPYGLLMPVVPAELRERAGRTDRNPLARA